MRSVEPIVEGEISIVGEQATIRLARRDSPILARVLGIERAEGQERVYLDRLVHQPYHTGYCGYQPAGCISTILTRRLDDCETAVALVGQAHPAS